MSSSNQETDNDESCVVASTPLKTVRNLKIRQSNIRETDMSELDATSSKQLPSNSNILARASSNNLSNQIRINEQATLQNITSQSKCLEQVDKPPIFKRKLQPEKMYDPHSPINMTVTQLQRFMSHDENISSTHNNIPNGGDSSFTNSRKSSQFEQPPKSILRQSSSGENAFAERKLLRKISQASNEIQQNLRPSQSHLSSQLQTLQELNNVLAQNTLLPLNDKTNIEGERRQFHRFPGKMATTKDPHGTHFDENTMGTTKNIIPASSKMEYINIDLKMAIHFVMSKSKTLKEKVEEQNISLQMIKNAIHDNRVFQIEYNMFLQKQINRKALNYEFRNVSKKMFEKLEMFFLNHLQKHQESIDLQARYIQQSQAIQTHLQERIIALKAELDIPFFSLASP